MPTPAELEAALNDLQAQIVHLRTRLAEIGRVALDLNNELALLKGHAQLAAGDSSAHAKDDLVQAVLSGVAKVQHLIRTQVEPKAAAPAGPGQPAAATAQSGRVLVVDDEERLCGLVHRILTREGLSVTVAHTGHDALAAIQTSAFDVVFLDLNLLDMNGMEVLREIRKHPGSPHVVFLSGDPSVEAMLKVVREHGADGLIRKPFDISEITNVVSYLLNARASLAGSSGQI